MNRTLNVNVRNSLGSFLSMMIFTVIMAGITWILNGKSFFGVDDANIYLVYMKNFANGHGFAYNAGGERVEGFTSLLWTLIGAFFFLITDHPEKLLLVFNIIIVSYALWRVCWFVNTSFNSDRFLSPQVLLFLGLLVAIPGYFEWCVLSLMETGLWSALLILLSLKIMEWAAAYPAKKANISFVTLLVLLVCTRPEAIVWGMAFVVIRFIQLYVDEGKVRHALFGIIIPSMCFIVALFLLISWRISYFGYPLPNTYYAKVSADTSANLKAGLLYVYQYLIENPIIVLLLCLSVMYVLNILKPVLNKQATFRSMLKDRFIPLFCVSIMFLTSFIPVFPGGDHFRYYRFIQPTTPIILLSLLFVVQYFKVVINRPRVLVTVIVVLFTSQLSLVWVVVKRKAPLRNEWSLARVGRKQSEMLNKLFEGLPRYPSQGVLIAGGTAYSYKGDTYDLLGLNDVQMAHADKVKATDVPKNHASFNKDVFYKLKPDLFWLSGIFRPVGDYGPLPIGRFSATCFKNIYRDERFKSEYSNCMIIRKGMPQALSIFASNDFLNTLDTTQFRVIRYF